MKPTRRFLPLSGLLATAGLLVLEPREASAQIPVYSTERVFAPVGPVMTSQTIVGMPGPIGTTAPAYVVPGQPIYRTQRRYFTRRPNYYGGRSPLSFAPYSDAYPKTAPLQPTHYPVYYPVYPR
jgi:hypothetical protein